MLDYIKHKTLSPNHMKTQILILIIAVLSVTSCNLIPTNESRIAGYKERCVLIGYAQGTKDNSLCVLELEKSHEEGKSQRSSSNSGSGGGMSFMCKNAISSGDSGAINVHCN